MVYRFLVMLPRAGFKELLLWLLRQRRRFCVRGYSMAGLFKPGDDVLVKSVDAAIEGEFVVARHPDNSSIRLLKRVVGVKDGQYLLKSMCHPNCAWRVERVEGVVTSIL